MALSDQLDEEFENQRDEICQVQLAQQQQVEDEMEFILDNRQDISNAEVEGPVDDLQLQQSQNQSKTVYKRFNTNSRERICKHTEFKVVM